VQLPGVVIIDPQPYLDTQALVSAARVVLTDSGGLQKEAAFHQRPCITLRDRTEWGELVDAGVNVLVGADSEKIVSATTGAAWPAHGLPAHLYGDGRSAEHIAAALAAHLAGGGSRVSEVP
jgi:UDP-GlcNAc3NAcA epimerase